MNFKGCPVRYVVAMSHPTYVFLAFLAVAGIVVLGLFAVTEATILVRGWRLTRADRSWYPRAGRSWRWRRDGLEEEDDEHDEHELI